MSFFCMWISGFPSTILIQVYFQPHKTVIFISFYNLFPFLVLSILAALLGFHLEDFLLAGKLLSVHLYWSWNVFVFLKIFLFYLQIPVLMSSWNQEKIIASYKGGEFRRKFWSNLPLQMKRQKLRKVKWLTQVVRSVSGSVSGRAGLGPIPWLWLLALDWAAASDAGGQVIGRVQGQVVREQSYDICRPLVVLSVKPAAREWWRAPKTRLSVTVTRGQGPCLSYTSEALASSVVPGA